MPLIEAQLKTLADMQLAQLIQKGQWAEKCKAEWYRRWKMEYPWYHSASGIRRYGEG